MDMPIKNVVYSNSTAFTTIIAVIIDAIIEKGIMGIFHNWGGISTFKTGIPGGSGLEWLKR